MKLSLLQLPSSIIHIDGRKNNVNSLLSQSCSWREIVFLAVETLHSLLVQIY
jgi:hypothetical protein